MARAREGRRLSWSAWLALGLCLIGGGIALAATPPTAFDWLSDVVTRHGLGVGLVAVFVGGLALNLTPCVYPMIPVTLAFFSQQAAGSLRRAAAFALCYVVGLSLTYALLGMFAAHTGAFFGSWLQRPAVLLALAAVMVALSLSLFGLYDLRLPPSVTQRFGHASAGYGGALLMGALVGVVAAPCIGPFVLGLLLIAGRLANPAVGFLLFFVLGLGMGLPYVVLAVGAQRVGRLPTAGPWLRWSKQGLGVVLLGVALYFLKPLLPAAILRWAVVGLLIVAGIRLGWLDRIEAEGRVFRWSRRLLGGTVMLAAIISVWPRSPSSAPVAWRPYSDAALAQARREGTPALIDVYADWCLPCVEMDHTSFRQPQVVAALRGVATLRLDVTSEVSSEGQALLERFEVYGAPTVLLFDRRGQERGELRVTGFVTADELLKRLRQM